MVGCVPVVDGFEKSIAALWTSHKLTLVVYNQGYEDMEIVDDQTLPTFVKLGAYISVLLHYSHIRTELIVDQE